MSVKITRDVLQEFLRKTLFEDNDQSQVAFDDSDGQGTTIPLEVPVQPAEMMAAQLVDQRPPIEDDEFVPDNVEELGRAVKALSGQVPPDKISNAYKEFQRIVDNIGSVNPPHAERPTELGMSANVAESALRKAIQIVLSEARWEGDDDLEIQGAEEARLDIDYSAMDDPPVDNEPDGQNLDDLASTFGYSGASGARQEIERMLQRLRYISDKMGPGEMETLQDFAVQEFIDLMRVGDYIDDDDVVELQQNTSTVKGLDSFRFFFVGGIMIPAYNEIKRSSRKDAEALIASLGLPGGMRQSILNQALGEVPKNMDKLETKLLKLASSEGINDSGDLQTLVGKMKEAFPAIEEAASPGEGLLDLAVERWGRQAKGRKIKALAQALQSTADWQDLSQ
jgi:hypothetical protein